MKNKSHLKANVIALLEIYKASIDSLIMLILPLSSIDLNSIRDFETQNEDCTSIQSILEHVIYAGYIYTYYYASLTNNTMQWPVKNNYPSNASVFAKELNNMFDHCSNFFNAHANIIIEETNNEKKILTKWGQLYDIEQLFEHSIVHIFRHKIQIENFMNSTNTASN